MFLHIRADIHLWHKACLSIEVLVSDELLHGIDSNRLVNGATGTGILAAAVAHATADCREGVLALDKLQGFGIFALSGFLQVALYGDMGRTSRLTGCGTRRIAVDAVLVAVVFRPLMRTPFLGIGEFLFGIGLLAMFGAEFLSQTHSTCRAVFHAATTSHTILRVYMSHIGTTRHVRGVEKL